MPDLRKCGGPGSRGGAVPGGLAGRAARIVAGWGVRRRRRPERGRIAFPHAVVVAGLGMRGSGKSFLAAHGTRYERRLMVIDPAWNPSKTLAADPWRKLAKVGSLDDALDHLEAHADRDFRAVFRGPESTEPERVEPLLDVLASMHDCTVVVDEMDLFVSPQYLPAALHRIVAQGRHRRQGLVAIARQPAELHNLIRGQAAEFYSSAQFEPAALAYCRERVCAEIDFGDVPPHNFIRRRATGELDLICPHYYATPIQ